MKVVERVLEGQSNMGGERVGMSIDTSALAHIMSVLTDLYSDPELAVIREYSTNALDSHVEAGVSRPIEVTLPSPLSPFLRIRDYGVGLDATGIREVYSQYGTSTKRDSNDVVGMLGLGCKSALTYSDQFTLTGIKDGIMTQVSVSRDEDGSGSMTIVAQNETDAAPGVEVIVPAKRHNAFEAKAHSFFSYWEDGCVLVNGEKPQRVEGLWLNDSLCLSQNQDQSYVVMGNVAYPIPDEHDPAPTQQNRYGQKSHRVVAFVPIGAVQFTPSREALQMTKLTKDTLARIKAEVASLLAKSIQNQITNAPTAKEARKVAAEGRLLGLTLDFSYKGHTVVDALNRINPDPVLARTQARDGADSFLVAGADSYRRKSGERSLQVNLEAAYNRETIWFKNFENVELSPTMREKLRAYAVRKNLTLDNTRLVLSKVYSADELFWLGGNEIHNWEDVAAIKLEAKERTLESGRPKGSYQGRQDGTWSNKILAETIDTSKPILWERGNQYTLRQEPVMRLNLIPDNATLIALPANRIDKFKRDFPKAQSLTEFGKAVAKKWITDLPAEKQEAIAFQRHLRYEITKLKGLDPTRVDDPALKKGIQLVSTDVSIPNAKLDNISRWIHTDSELPKPMDDPTAKYPLLVPTRGNSKEREHVYLYLNAVYAAEGSA